MKDLFKNGVIVLLVIGALYILYLRECKRSDCPPDGQVLIPQQTWDSILALSNKPPEIKIETLLVKGDPIYIPGQPLPRPEPDLIDTTVNHYSDSLVRKDVNVHINFTIRGELIDRLWWYAPVISSVRQEVTIYVPKVVSIEKLVKTPQNGLFLYGAVGGNLNSFIPGAGVDYITKKGTEIGYEYQRFGEENIHSVKLGIKLFPRK